MAFVSLFFSSFSFVVSPAILSLRLFASTLGKLYLALVTMLDNFDLPRF